MIGIKEVVDFLASGIGMILMCLALYWIIMGTLVLIHAAYRKLVELKSKLFKGKKDHLDYDD